MMRGTVEDVMALAYCVILIWALVVFVENAVHLAIDHRRMKQLDEMYEKEGRSRDEWYLAR